MGDPGRRRTELGQPLGDLARARAGSTSASIVLEQRVAHQGVPEPVAGLGRLDDAAPSRAASSCW